MIKYMVWCILETREWLESGTERTFTLVLDQQCRWFVLSFKYPLSMPCGCRKAKNHPSPTLLNSVTKDLLTTEVPAFHLPELGLSFQRFSTYANQSPVESHSPGATAHCKIHDILWTAGASAVWSPTKKCDICFMIVSWYLHAVLVVTSSQLCASKHLASHRPEPSMALSLSIKSVSLSAPVSYDGQSNSWGPNTNLKRNLM